MESTESARCAAHPMVAATAACERCGNYMCEECTETGEQAICPSCRERTGAGAFPFHRGNFDLGQVLSFAVDRFKEQWVPLSLAMLVIFGVNILFSMVNQGITAAISSGMRMGGGDGLAAVGIVGVISLLLTLAGMVIQIWLQLGMTSICLKTVQGFEAELGDIFGQGARLLPALAQMVLLYLVVGGVGGIAFGIAFGIGAAAGETAGLIVGVGFGLVMLPVFIYVSLGLFGMQIELVGDPTVGPIDAIKRSWAIADGFRLSVFLYMLVGMVLMMAGFIACCVGILPAGALATLMLNAIYLALRNGADI